MSEGYYEVSFDGLVGMTHNYSGLSHDNVACVEHKDRESNPLGAVLQGIEKMRLLVKLGVKQGVILPPLRPEVEFLRRIGFDGESEEAVVEKAYGEGGIWLSVASSASGMWTANAATVTPSVDTVDKRCHITPANLVMEAHRALESEFTRRQLGEIFKDERYFECHEELPRMMALADEGAANHTRLCEEEGGKGLHVFVYGRSALRREAMVGRKYIPRQTLEASEAIVRRHRIGEGQVVYLKQGREAVDAGVFHNDVISVGHRNFLWVHEKAYEGGEEAIEHIKKQYKAVTGGELKVCVVKEAEVSLAEAVNSYLFNSQVVTGGDGRVHVIAPQEVYETEATRRFMEGRFRDIGVVGEVHYLNLRESMRNGGGPACLRLRVVVNEEEIKGIERGFMVDLEKLNQLEAWAKRHYRTSLVPKDLRDRELWREVKKGLEELVEVLKVSNGIYGF